MLVNINCIVLLIDKHQQIGKIFRCYLQIINWKVIRKKVLVPVFGQDIFTILHSTKKVLFVLNQFIFNNDTRVSIVPFPEINQIKGALQNMKLSKKAPHKKFRPTQYRISEQSKKITGFKSVNVKFK